MNKHLITTRLAAIVALALSPLAAHATPNYLTPLTATGSGTYTGNPSVLMDRVIPAQTTAWNTPNVVVDWASTAAASFTLNYGAIDTISSVFLAADNNDTYTVSYSTDGISYKTLFTVVPSDGTVTATTGGLDYFSSDLSSPYYVQGSGFLPVHAQYLQLTASGPDELYAAAELDAYGMAATPVPEPATLALLGGGLLGTGVMARRRRSALTATAR